MPVSQSLLDLFTSLFIVFSAHSLHNNVRNKAPFSLVRLKLLSVESYTFFLVNNDNFFFHSLCLAT